MSELLPCPFCGSDEVNYGSSQPANDKGGLFGSLQYNWICPDCIAVGPIADSIEEATRLWNTRPKGEV